MHPHMLHQDGEDFSFAVTVDRNQVAMVLVHIDGIVAINAAARSALQTLWSDDYESRIEPYIPQFVDQLIAGDFGMVSVKMLRSDK